MNEYILNVILCYAKWIPKLGRGAQQETRMITTTSILFPPSFPAWAAPELVFSIHLFPISNPELGNGYDFSFNHFKYLITCWERWDILNLPSCMRIITEKAGVTNYIS